MSKNRSKWVGLRKISHYTLSFSQYTYALWDYAIGEAFFAV